MTIIGKRAKQAELNDLAADISTLDGLIDRYCGGLSTDHDEEMAEYLWDEVADLLPNDLNGLLTLIKTLGWEKKVRKGLDFLAERIIESEADND